MQAEDKHQPQWVPSRAAALTRLEQYVPRAGRAYARERNTDEGWHAGEPAGPSLRTGVSGLSPWIARRLLLEAEVVRAAVAAHGPRDCEKFVQEVLWRTYWKGWLEMRSSVWEDYEANRARDKALVEHNGRLARAYERATSGGTGIDCFDHWIHELSATGYLHNHARMWFASIWVFTLKLPWTLGAAHFERHLLDRDAASNTLSWRWVAGLHTRGKCYAARASNIRKFTGGRFDPAGDLDEDPVPLREEADHPREPLADYPDVEEGPRSGLLVTTEDLVLERSELRGLGFVSVAGGLPESIVSPERTARNVREFDTASLENGVQRAAGHFAAKAERIADGRGWVSAVESWARSHELERVVAVAPAVGPWIEPVERLRPALAARNIELTLHRRAWDRDLFPHATAGYFKFKKLIPGLVRDLPRPGRPNA